MRRIAWTSPSVCVQRERLRGRLGCGFSALTVRRVRTAVDSDTHQRHRTSQGGNLMSATAQDRASTTLAPPVRSAPQSLWSDARYQAFILLRLGFTVAPIAFG